MANITKFNDIVADNIKGNITTNNLKVSIIEGLNGGTPGLVDANFLTLATFTNGLELIDNSSLVTTTQLRNGVFTVFNGNSGQGISIRLPQDGSDGTIATREWVKQYSGKEALDFEEMKDNYMDLSNTYLYIDTNAKYGSSWSSDSCSITSSGGYTISIGGPPDVYFKGPNDSEPGTKIYDRNTSTWLVDKIYLPKDFGYLVSVSSSTLLSDLGIMFFKIEFLNVVINYGNSLILNNSSGNHILNMRVEEEEDNNGIVKVEYGTALVFSEQYRSEGSGRLRLDTDGITMSGTTYYNNGTLNLTNSTIVVNGNTGTAGQVLTSTGSGLEWRTPSGGGGGTDTSNLVYLASTTDRTEQTVSLITRMKDIYFGTMSGVTTGYSDKHLCAKGFMDDMHGTWLLFPDDWAKGSSAYNDTIATEEYVTSRINYSVPKIYATESGTTTVGTLRVYTDSNGYLHIKTS